MESNSFSHPLTKTEKATQKLINTKKKKKPHNP